MNERRAFFWLGFMVLVWSVFWAGAIRVIAVRRDAKSANGSPAARGLLVAL